MSETEVFKDIVPENKVLIIAGGSGFIGSALSKHFIAAGYTVKILTRTSSLTESSSQNKLNSPVHYLNWDGKQLDSQILENSTALINLAGKSINCVFNSKNRAEILSSRLEATRALNIALENCKNPPKIFIQASATGIYGNQELAYPVTADPLCKDNLTKSPHENPKEKEFTENCPPSTNPKDFLAQVCIAWEKEFLNSAFSINDVSKNPKTKRVITRIGIVLSRNQDFSPDNVLNKLERVTKLFLGGSVGDGEQYFSWISLDDLVRTFFWIVENETTLTPQNSLERNLNLPTNNSEIYSSKINSSNQFSLDTPHSIFNLTAPHPLKNKDLMSCLRKVFHRPWSPPVPKFVVKLVAQYILQIDPSLAVSGNRVLPKNLLNSGFEFKNKDFQSLY